MSLKWIYVCLYTHTNIHALEKFENRFRIFVIIARDQIIKE